MENARTVTAAALVTALVACSGTTGPASGGAPEAVLGAELENARVKATEDVCSGTEVVTLVDASTGSPLITDTERIPADGAACSSGGLAALSTRMALAEGQ